MPRLKLPYQVLDDQRGTITGQLTISLELPKNVSALAEMIGVGKEEQENLLGQALAEIAQMLGDDSQ